MHRKEREERKGGSNKWRLMSGARCRRGGKWKKLGDRSLLFEIWRRRTFHEKVKKSTGRTGIYHGFLIPN